MKGEKFCSYGQHFVPVERVRLRRNRRHGAPPSYICDSCLKTRQLTREQIDKLTEEERAVRRASAVSASRRALEKRKEVL